MGRDGCASGGSTAPLCRLLWLVDKRRYLPSPTAPCGLSALSRTTSDHVLTGCLQRVGELADAFAHHHPDPHAAGVGRAS
jgi:hypothetical protein